MNRSFLILFLLAFILGCSFFFVRNVEAISVRTQLNIAVCGNGILEGGEQCDNPGDQGTYSTLITGRNCTSTCIWAPYCGDSIVQTIHSESCDDGNNVSDDFCSSDCQAESIPPGAGDSTPTPIPNTGGGGGGGSGNFNPGTTIPIPESFVSITGKAYPNSSVNILKDGRIVGVVKADTKADFLFTLSGVTPGTATFGFWAEDQSGLKSIAFNTTLHVVQGAVTTISGVFIPPTITLNKKVVGRGEVINMSGSSVPDSKITTIVNSSHEIRTVTDADKDGKWNLEFNTAPLEDGAHQARAFFSTKLYDHTAKSDFSQTIAFFVGGEPVGEPKGSDINGDNKVNLTDFSIMLFNWGPSGGGTSSDLNSDNTVNLTDFSILLFNWTG